MLLGLRNPIKLSYLWSLGVTGDKGCALSYASTLSARLATEAAVAGLGRCWTAKLKDLAVEGARLDFMSPNSLYLDALLD